PSAFTDWRAREVMEVISRLVLEEPAGGNSTSTGEGGSDRKRWSRLVFDNVLTHEASAWVGGLIMAGPPPGDASVLVDDCVQRLERARIERRASEVRELILQREGAG